MRHARRCFLIRLYQWTLSPLLGPRCRFYPSLLALRARGRAALRRAARRLARPAAPARCHPWHPGGFDPVPAAARAFATARCHAHANHPRLYLWVALAHAAVLRTTRPGCTTIPPQSPAPQRRRGTRRARGGTPRQPTSQPAAARAPAAARRRHSAAGAAAAGAAAAATESAPSAPAACRRGAGACAHRRTRYRHQHPRAARSSGSTCSRTRKSRARRPACGCENDDARRRSTCCRAASRVRGERATRRTRDLHSAAQRLSRWTAASELRVPLHLERRTASRSPRRSCSTAATTASASSTRSTTAAARRGAARPTRRSCATIRRTKRSYFNVDSYAFTGPAIWDGNKYQQARSSPKRSDSHLSLEVTDGWIAALQHHFVSAVVPPRDAPYHFTLEDAGDQYLLAATGPDADRAAGRERRTFDADAVRRARSCRRSSRRSRPSSAASPTTAS